MPVSSSKIVAISSFTLSILPLMLCGASRPAYAQVSSFGSRPQTSFTDQFIQKNSLPFTSRFTSAYRDYIDLTNKEQASGLRRIATPDFAIYDDYRKKTLRGEEAFVEAAKIYDGTKDNLNHTMRFSVAKLTDDYAIIYAEETISTVVDVKDDLTPEQRAKVAAKGLKTTSKSTMTWRWRHTWRKTSQGWRLASLARDNRTEAERKSTSGMMYHVGHRTSVPFNVVDVDGTMNKIADRVEPTRL